MAYTLRGKNTLLWIGMGYFYRLYERFFLHKLNIMNIIMELFYNNRAIHKQQKQQHQKQQQKQHQ